MFSCVPFALMRVKTIFVPSGDQPGWKQDVDLGFEKAPPQAGADRQLVQPAAVGVDDPDRETVVFGAARSEQDLVPARRPAAAEEFVQDHVRGRDLPQPAAAEPRDEQTHLAVRVCTDEHEALAVGRVVAGDVVAAGIGGDPPQPPAVGRANRVDPVPVRVGHAEALAGKSLSVRGPLRAVSLERGIGRCELAEAAAVRVDDVGGHAVVAAEDRDLVAVR